MACILIEMYTGELFYQGREEVEHLAMIEKQCGPIPEWMASSSNQKQLFGQETKIVEKVHKMRLNWPECRVRDGAHLSWIKMRTLDQLVQHEHDPVHRYFLDLL